MSTGTERRQKQCSSCGAAFECAPGGCWCGDVPVDARALCAISERFADCLCPRCLTEWANGRPSPPDPSVS